MFFKDFVSVKRQKIKKGASQTYDTPSGCCWYIKITFFLEWSLAGDNVGDALARV